MAKGIKIGGVIEVPSEVTQDEVLDKFIDFIEANGWYFGGGVEMLEEDIYEKEDN